MFTFRFLIASLFLITAVHLPAQKIRYENESLSKVLQDIDTKSDLNFNYDATLIEDFTYDGTIDLSTIKDDLKIILQDTPFSYEIIDDNILIVLTEKNNYKICGWVLDKSYNTNLIGANVYAGGIDLGTLTNNQGYFEIELQAYKNQKITISYIGYLAKKLRLVDLIDQDCNKIHLTNDTDLLGSEIVITDYIHRGITEGESYNSTSIDISKTINATSDVEHDVLKTVQMLPGITSLDESAGNLTIRGSTPDQNMLVWERATLYDSGHMFGMISTVNPFVLDEVNVYKGVFDPSFDNRIGGLIEMSLPNEMPQKISGGFGTTLSEAHTHLSMPLIKNKLAFIISGRRSINDLINSPTINSYTDKIFQRITLNSELTQEEEDYRDLEESINFADTNFKLFYQPSPKLSFKSSFLFSNNQFESYTLDGADENGDNLMENTWAFSNELSYQWNNNITSTLFLVDSDYSFLYESTLSVVSFLEEEEEDQTVLLGSNEVQNNINDLSIGLSNAITVNRHSNLNIDLSIDVKDVKYLYEETSIFELGTQETGFEKGLFTNLSSSYEYEKDRLQLMLGARASYYHQLSEPYVSPRMSLQYLLKKGLKLKASAGKMYQFISQLTLNEDNDLGSLRNFWVMASENSDEILHSNKLSLGMVGNYKGWLVDIESYYNKSYGLSSLSANLNAGVDLIESGESSSMGIELLVKKQWRNYTGWLNYSRSKNEYFFEDEDMDPFPANNDHRHNLSFVNSYNYKGLIFSLNYSYRSGFPYSKPNGITGNIGEDNYTLNFEELNNYRLKSNQRLDSSLTYQKPIFKDKYKAELSLSVINILNARNIYTRDSYLVETDSGVPTFSKYNKYLLRRTPKFLVRIYW